MSHSHTDPRDSNPQGAGAEGLQGDMGISSERTGPYGDAPRSGEGIQGTGSHGSAATSTEGTMSTKREHPQEPAEGRSDVGAPGADAASSQEGASTGGTAAQESEEDDEDGSIGAVAHGPEMDDTQQRATQAWRDEQPAAVPRGEGVDVTSTGERNTAQVPSQDFDRAKSPGHSHG